jgi:hypothetical protein
MCHVGVLCGLLAPEVLLGREALEVVPAVDVEVAAAVDVAKLVDTLRVTWSSFAQANIMTLPTPSGPTSTCPDAVCPEPRIVILRGRLC